MTEDIPALVARLRAYKRDSILNPEKLCREAAAALEEMQAEKDCIIIDYQNAYARAERAEAEREALRVDAQQLRKILAHVPARIALKAKEDAGLGVAIHAARAQEQKT